MNNDNKTINNNYLSLDVGSKKQHKNSIMNNDHNTSKNIKYKNYLAKIIYDIYIGSLLLVMILLYLFSILFNSDDDQLLSNNDSLIEVGETEINDQTENNKHLVRSERSLFFPAKLGMDQELAKIKYSVEDTSIESDSNYDNSLNIDNLTELYSHNKPEIEALNTDIEYKILESQLLNIETYINNSNIKIITTNNNILSSQDINNIKDICIDTLSVENKYLLSPISQASDTSSSTSEDDSEKSIYEKLIKEIRSGSTVTIYSPTVDGYSPSNISDSKLEIVEKSESKQDIDNNSPLTKHEEIPTREKIIIITKPSETPIPLPSLFEVPREPDNIEDRKLWEKDNLIRKYWAAKYPLFSEHHEKIQFSLAETVHENNDLGNINTHVDTRQNVEHLHRNSIIDKNEELCLDKLFLEENKSEKPNTDLLDTDEETGIKNLFKTKPWPINVEKSNLHKDEENFIDSLDDNIKQNIKENLKKEKKKIYIKKSYKYVKKKL